MTVEQTDLVTLGVWLGYRLPWLVWELYLLRRRGQRIMVRTISQVAQRRAWQLNAVVYCDAGLLSHLWWNTATWEGTFWTGLIFWLAIPALLVRDVLDWRTPRALYTRWQRWTRWPLGWAVVGILAGHFLFPQVGPAPWRWGGFSW